MITKPKGTYDIYGVEALKRRYVNDILSTLCEKYNYGFIETPVFESSELFHRGVGDTSDIVEKETYDFKDRGERELTLRPEGTAGVVRWFVENKLYGNLTDSVKVSYNMKMYRYERPQKGRNRELTQWGFECFGAASVEADAEVISLAYNAYQLLGLEDVTIKLNSLGDAESRKRYREALLNYLLPHKNELCEDCQKRLEKNPLRVLDCKVDSGSSLFEKMPRTIEYLNIESKKRFERLLELLDLMDISYEVDTNLVRGLDYYNHTVFEVVLKDSYALGGGGRYDGLVETLGGPSVPGVGFAMGYDRTLLALEEENINIPIDDTIDVYLLAVSETERETALYLAQDLRMASIKVEIDVMEKSLKAQFKSVERLKAKYLIVLNDEELSRNEVTVKDTITKEEKVVKINNLTEFFNER